MLRKALDAIRAAVLEAAAAARRSRRWPRARFRPDDPRSCPSLGARRETSRRRAFVAPRFRRLRAPVFARPRRVPEGTRAAAACRELDRAPIACDVARRALSVHLPGQRHYGDAALGRLVAPYVGLADHAAPCAAGNGADPSTPSRWPHYRFPYPIPHRHWPRCCFPRLSLPFRHAARDPPPRPCDVLRCVRVVIGGIRDHPEHICSTAAPLIKWHE